MNRRRLKTCLFGGYEKESVLEYTQTLLLGYQWEILQLQRQLEGKNVLLEKEQAKLADLSVQLDRKDMLLKELWEEKVQRASRSKAGGGDIPGRPEEKMQRASVPFPMRKTMRSGSDRMTELPDQGAREL